MLFCHVESVLGKSRVQTQLPCKLVQIIIRLISLLITWQYCELSQISLERQKLNKDDQVSLKHYGSYILENI